MARSARRSVVTAHGQTAARETQSSVFNAHGKRALFPFEASPPVHKRARLSKFRASEASRLSLDCLRSRTWEAEAGTALRTTIACKPEKTDVERLVAEATGNQTPAASEAQEADTKPQPAASEAQKAETKPQATDPDAQEAETKPQATASEAKEAGPLTQAVARWLRHLFRDGRPAWPIIQTAGRAREQRGRQKARRVFANDDETRHPAGVAAGPDWAKPGQTAPVFPLKRAKLGQTGPRWATQGHRHCARDSGRLKCPATRRN